jgi:hypothetical protein
VTGDSTIRTKALDALRGVPWPKEYSLRFLKNKLTDEWADREAEAFRAFGTLSEKYAQARAQNDLDTVAVICGEDTSGECGTGEGLQRISQYDHGGLPDIARGFRRHHPRGAAV